MFHKAKRSFLALFGLAALLALMAVWPQSTYALGRYVDPVAGVDVGNCANAAAPCQTIAYAISQSVSGDVINLVAGTYNEHDLVIDKDLEIAGPDRMTTFIDAGSSGRVATIPAGVTKVTFKGVTLQRGDALVLPAGDQNGGAIRLLGDKVIFINSRLRWNNALAGGAVSVEGNGRAIFKGAIVLLNSATGPGGAVACDDCDVVKTRNSRFSRNTAGSIGGAIWIESSKLVVEKSRYNKNEADVGGAIWNTGSEITIKDSTLNENMANNGDGGALFTTSGEQTVRIFRSTLHDNTAAVGNGGAVYAGSGILEVMSSTFSANTAMAAGAITLLNGADATIYNTTFAHNGATFAGGAGTLNHGGVSLQMSNSIITLTASGPDCTIFGALSGRNNLVDSASCGAGAAYLLGAVTNFDPVLADNGGRTLTHMINAGSNAIDGAWDAHCINPQSGAPQTNDQRLFSRPVGLHCDVGSVEVQ